MAQAPLRLGTPCRKEGQSSVRVSTTHLHITHARVVAQLHARCIVTGFLSTLGDRFLARLYRAIAEDAESIVLVALRPAPLEGPAVVGFIAGTRNTRAMYLRILRANWLAFSLLLLPRAFSPRVLKYILETMAYGRRSEAESQRANSGTDAELLSVAVDPDARGLGIGRELVREFEQWLDGSAQGKETAKDEPPATRYKVVTSAADTASNAFYRSCGFTLASTFRHHGNEMNEYYRGGRRSRPLLA